MKSAGPILWTIYCLNPGVTMHPLPVLLTRPEADARRLAAQLHAVGAGRVVISPLLRIEAETALPPIEGAVLLTSSNAVEAYVALGGAGGLEAWVVGPRTAELATHAGFRVRAVAQDVDHLVGVIPPGTGPLLHLRGGVTRGDLIARLRARGHVVRDFVLYKQVPQDLTAEALDLLHGGPVLVPLYSPRTAELFAAACPAGAHGNLRILALSAAVAEMAPVPVVGQAETPDGTAMIRLVQKHLHVMGG